MTELEDRSEVSLGDRMKAYEAEGLKKECLDNDKPFLARIDGHSFSKFTAGFRKPYDELLSTAMIRTTGDLVNEFQARTGYTQSDEITLVFMPKQNQETGEWSNLPFNGRVVKLATLLASFAGVRFNFHLINLLNMGLTKAKETGEKLPYSEGMIKKVWAQKAHFDARLFSVPNQTEVYNNIFWRSKHDCARNSVSGLARKYFSTKELNGKNTLEMKKMLLEKDVDYEKMPPGFKYGSFVKKEKYQLEAIDQKTNQEVTSFRTKIRVWSHKLEGFDQKFSELLADKYFE